MPLTDDELDAYAEGRPGDYVPPLTDNDLKDHEDAIAAFLGVTERKNRAKVVAAVLGVKSEASLKHIRRREISAFSPADEAGDPKDDDVDEVQSLMATIEAARPNDSEQRSWATERAHREVRGIAVYVDDLPGERKVPDRGRAHLGELVNPYPHPLTGTHQLGGTWLHPFYTTPSCASLSRTAG